jgi:peptidoglycan-associated lipoprotein
MRLNHSGLKAVSLFAALFLVAACSSKPATTDAGSGTGASSTPAASGPVPGSQEDFVVNVGDRVFFDLDKSDIRPDAQATLQKQAAWLAQYPQKTLTVEGHCDERGTREYNLALGERRANAVKKYLVSLGVDASRLTTISYGKERPVALGSDEASWAQNRRGVSVVTN